MKKPGKIIEDGSTRQPKGDHNRRLSLGIDAARFAAEAGIPVEALKDYESTGPDHRFDAHVAQRVGETLDRLEAILPNSQTGRQHPMGAVRIDDVGHLFGLPVLDMTEAFADWPRYGPGKGN